MIYNCNISGCHGFCRCTICLGCYSVLFSVSLQSLIVFSCVHVMHELLRFVKLEILSHPCGGLRGNVDASCIRRWKKRGRLSIGDN